MPAISAGVGQATRDFSTYERVQGEPLNLTVPS
jgi:hypothetical protein